MTALVTEREIACKAPRNMLWRALADTERLNRTIGLGPITPRPTDQGGAARFLISTVSGGFPLEYEEKPFEFVRGERYTVRRTVKRGLIDALEHSFELRDRVGGGTEVRIRLTVEASNPLIAPIVKLQLGRFAARLEQEIEELDRELEAGAPACFRATRSSVDEPALERARAALRQRLPEERRALADALADYVQSGSDADVGRMRPFEIAAERGLPPRDLLAASLTAVTAGLLELSWDLVCPSCRTASERVGELGALPAAGHCQLCDLDFELEFDRSVEATFRPSPAIRRGLEGPFCIGGPMLMPHVVEQAILPAGGRVLLTAPRTAGRYRVFVRGGGSATVEVREQSGRGKVELFAAEQKLTPQRIEVAPGTPIEVRQDLTNERHVKLEELTWASRAATAHAVSTLPEFRRLFATDVLKAGITLRVARVALLFTDLTGSTALYSRVGDARAFAVVHEHFGVLSRVVADHGGTVVKTIGDAVMASFVDEGDAVAAAVAMHRAFPAFRAAHADASELYLRVGVYAGPCYVVTANGVLDYFGQSVNVAARLQGTAEAGELVLAADAVPHLREQGRLEQCGQPRVASAKLKGVDGEMELVAFTLDGR